MTRKATPRPCKQCEVRERRGISPCDCPLLRNVGFGWYCGIHGYQDPCPIHGQETA